MRTLVTLCLILSAFFVSQIITHQQVETSELENPMIGHMGRDSTSTSYSRDSNSISYNTDAALRRLDHLQNYLDNLQCDWTQYRTGHLPQHCLEIGK